VTDQGEPSERQAVARAALAAALSATGADSTAGADSATKANPAAGNSSSSGAGSPAGHDATAENGAAAGSRARARSRARAAGNSSRAADGAADGGASADPGHATDPAERARALCLRLLASRPRTRTELADAMRRHGVPDEASTAVLARFADVGLIDDAVFARAWVESRHHNRGLARRALSAELKRRGVDGQDIEAAVSALDPADEMATARQLVAKAMKASRGKPLPVRIRRLVGLLARKGYPAPAAYRIVREAIEQEGIDAAGAGVDLDEAAWATPDADLDAG
jgi:regulatory protein